MAIGVHRSGLFARNHAIGCNANGTVKGVPIFWRGIQKNLYGQILRMVALCICAKFWANRHSYDSQNFLGVHSEQVCQREVPPVESADLTNNLQ